MRMGVGTPSPTKETMHKLNEKGATAPHSPPQRINKHSKDIAVDSNRQVLSPDEVDTVVRKLRTLASLIEACPGDFASNPSSFLGEVRS